MTSTYKEFYQKYNISKLKFFENNNWIVFLRFEQKTSFSLMLAIKHDITKMSNLTSDHYKDLKDSISKIENFLCGELNAFKVNYICLMMVDEIVHFHVFPRFKKQITYKKIKLIDPYYPLPIDLMDGKSLEINEIMQVLQL